MGVKISNRCIKMLLPNKKVVDILTLLQNEITQWIDNEDGNESGGYIVGYKHSDTGNVSLEAVSHPYKLDKSSKSRFQMKDPRHKLFLIKAKTHNSYYMGVWHSHPENVPTPSSIDWDDWHQTMMQDRTGCEYIFFIIIGYEEMRVWAGEVRSGKIIELLESCKKNNLYL